MIVKYYNEIQKCFKQKLYLAALHMALSMPDFCSKVMFPNIQGTTERYIKFIDETITPTETYEGNDLPYLTGEVIYQIRCSLLHDLNPEPDKEKLRFENSPEINKFKILTDLQVDMTSSEGEYWYSAYRLALIISEGCYHYYSDNKDRFENIKNDLIIETRSEEE